MIITQRVDPIESDSAAISSARQTRQARRNPFIFLLLAAALLVSLTQFGCIGLTGANSTDPTVTTTVAVGGATGSFGSVTAGSSTTQTFTVTNTGTATLTITQLAVTGTGYSVSGFTLPITVAAGKSTIYVAKFAPTTSGTVAGMISMTANTSPAVSTIALTGTGTSAGQPVMSLSPTGVSFGTAAISETFSQTITVTNAGSGTLTISNIAVAGAGFSVSSVPSLPISVAAGQSISFRTSMIPPSAGALSGGITIANNSPTPSVVIPLSGVGAAPGQTGISVSPVSINFGTAGVGVTLSQPVTVTNSGNATLSISNVIAAGSGFSVSGVTLPIQLAPLQSTTFSASMVPPTTGALSGSIIITNNSATPSVVVALSGTGGSSSKPSITVFPSNVAFGTVTVGATMSQLLTITNPSASTLNVSSVTAAGLGFSVTGVALPMSIPAGQSKTFNANIVPPSPGSLSGSVTIVNDSTTPSVVVGLSGTGASPSQPAISVSPASIAFGNVNVGAPSSQTVTVSNTGNATLNISSIAATGTGYTVSGFALPVSIAAGQSSTFAAKFTPGATGATSGSVTITSDAPTSPTSVALSGTGVQGQLTANPATAAFGNVAVGSTGSQTITLSNGGSASVTVSQASVSGTGFAISGITTPLTLSAGQTSTFTTTLVPASAGAQSGTITLTSNAPNPTTTISLNGTGTQPTIVLTPATVSFGNVTVGAPNSQAILLQNTGNATLTISQATVSGAGFSISGLTVPATIAAGTGKTFNVSFGPAAAGSVSGSVSLVTNAPGSPTAISLSGTGVATTMLLNGSTSSIAFGNVAVGSSSSQNVTLTNTGNSTVTIASVSVAGTGFSSSGITAGQTIGAGQSGTLSIQFAPASAAAVSGTVTVTSNATNSPISISLAGTGTQVQAHSVSLSWTASTSSVVGYNIYRSTTSGGPYSLITSTPVVGTTYTDSTVQAGLTYFYVVTSVDSNGNESVFSNEASVTVPTP